ncbi:PAS domain-containing protein [Phaeovulum vinaykumarii]|uniref:PAS domain-containing protein n=1 Tax=Phaeovulum vinaykumarii TaxID=407234 RepID=A0A1N7LIN8_9RHOB|nr:PAS domain-containing protein [Phaeovulum vinaykumarii]SIS73667.1 PAS domain-containing protein [Phaeovulum vinaykumarii]SOC04742.1 PAS domain-containing protein [Phaeovulum vinaykumarii]
MNYEDSLKDGVVTLGGFGNTHERVISDLRGYWEALRGGRPVPARSDVDPRGIERALEYTFILERVAPGMARFRLAGMHLSDLMGMEVRGMPLTAFFTPVARRQVAEALERVFQGPEVAELTLTAEAGIGKPSMNARLLLLPLKSDLGDITRVLGCLVSAGEIGRTPRRFDVVSVDSKPVIAGRPVDMPAAIRPRPTQPETPAPAARPASTFRSPFSLPGNRAKTEEPRKPAPQPAGFAEEQRAFDSARRVLTPEERRAMLRLVKSED